MCWLWCISKLDIVKGSIVFIEKGKEGPGNTMKILVMLQAEKFSGSFLIGNRAEMERQRYEDTWKR